MLIHADFSQRATVTEQQHHWIGSPQAGVERVMLDRIGAEQARATSLVRYAPDSRFPRHTHPGGEEILVLSGIFSDENGDYPAGLYLRNPPGSHHQPYSRSGAVIFVKLRQMPPAEHRAVRVDTRDASQWQRLHDREYCPLFLDSHEQVCLQRLPPGTALFSPPFHGAEILMLAGTLTESGNAYERGAWLRIPPGTCPEMIAGSRGAALYLKTGHLPGAGKKTG